MFIVERLIAAVAIVAAAHFSMGFINTSAGGSGGALTRALRHAFAGSGRGITPSCCSCES
jgi:hypothetical protein